MSGHIEISGTPLGIGTENGCLAERVELTLETQRVEDLGAPLYTKDGNVGGYLYVCQAEPCISVNTGADKRHDTTIGSVCSFGITPSGVHESSGEAKFIMPDTFAKLLITRLCALKRTDTGQQG